MLIPQLLRRIRTLPQTCPTARRVLKRAPPCVACRRSGSALPPSDHTRRSLILIDAESHLDCRAAPRRESERSRNDGVLILYSSIRKEHSIKCANTGYILYSS